jgi:HD-GYP domain-containing protein (c-di-GMP phosphodiesterase class II)
VLIKVETSELKVGMFIAELDRPWLDTPFLFQGFLIEDDEQLAALRRYCAFVSVDYERSVAGLLPASHLLSAAEAVEELGLFETGGFTADVDGQTPPGRLRLFLQRLTGMFGKRGAYRGFETSMTGAEHRAEEDESPPSILVHHDFIPASVELTYHHKTTTIEEEIGSAQQVYSLSQEFTQQVFSDIHSGKIISFDRVEEVIHNVVDSMVRNPDALLWVAHLKQQDTETYGHDLQVAVYLVAFGRNLCLPVKHLDHLCMLGLLLDIGKTKLPRALLTKQERLTQDEFELTKRHVGFGLDLLRNTPNLHPDILEGLAQHHEREDGSGYPDGLSAGRISLFGRMAAIVDAFVAITNVRPYAEALSALDTLRKLTLWSENLFHKPLVEQFIQAIGVFPVGSLVELSNGEIAVVIRQSRVRRLQPRVLVVCGPDKLPAPSFRVMDLLYQPDRDSERVHIMRGLPAGAYGLDPHEFYLS